MWWLDLLLAVSPVLPFGVGLIFGTACCCGGATACVVCSTVGGHKFPLCSNTIGSVTITISGMANGTCSDCSNLDGTWIRTTMCGFNVSSGLTACGGTRNPNIALSLSSGGSPGACTTGLVVTQTQALTTLSSEWATVIGPFSTTAAQCAALPGPHTIPHFASSPACDGSAATVTVQFSGV